MAKRTLIEQLDEAVDAIITRGDAPPSTADQRLATLAGVAVDLRDLPDEGFRLRLKADLERRAGMSGKPKTAAIPEGFHTITPYLQVEGAARLIDFVKAAFQAEETIRVPLPDGSLMHACVRIGDSMVEMADAGGEIPATPIAIHLYVQDADAAYERALRAGAASIKPPEDMFYGDREAGVKDPVGNNWYIATHLTREEGSVAGYIPAGLHSVTPYLHPRGAGRLIDFLTQAFAADQVQREASPDGTIVHAKVRIGDSILEMGEAHGEIHPMPAAIHLYVEDADVVYRSAIKAGANSLFEPRDEPYGDRVGGVTDPSGNCWYIATHKKAQR
jgi:uncharacterized glyoxalase superfamily protein PhnB